MENLDIRIKNILGIRLSINPVKKEVSGGVNKIDEIKRLFFEISRRENINYNSLLCELKSFLSKDNINPGKKFHIAKDYLIKKRYPLTSKKLSKFDIYFNRLKSHPEYSQVKTKQDTNKSSTIYIEKSVINSSFTKNFLLRLHPFCVQEIDSIKNFIKESKILRDNLNKKDIFVVRRRNGFIKRCPCTKFHISCKYYIFNLGFGCPYDCSYCYLQEYSNSPGIIINANIEDFFNEFYRFQKLNNKKCVRIGSGEFTDSLSLDYYTEYSKQLVEFFSDKNVLFELKTKSKNVKNLIGLKHNRKTIISWSVNPQKIIESEEKNTASLEERFFSARICQEEGYLVGIHFDPIIYYTGWEEDYKNLVNNLFDNINANGVAWISLGTLRFNPKLKGIIERRFPESNIIYEELIIGRDKKLRYPEFLRIQIYRKMIKWIRKRAPRACIYLCMESPKVWDKTIIHTESDVENYIINQVNEARTYGASKASEHKFYG